MAILEETKESLERIQKFKVATLPRKEELGVKFSFDDAVPHANRLISLFNKLPQEALEEFPEKQLQIIKQQADQVFQQFDEILNFDNAVADATARKQSLVDNLDATYQTTFTQLFPMISFSVARTVDFNRLEEQGRAAVRSISDQTDKVVRKLNSAKEQAEKTLDEVRTAAAEQGVSQQAKYFKNEADTESTNADKWKYATIAWAVGLGVYGVASIFLHKWTYLAPANIAEGITLTASKLIIFAVLIYMLLLSARNFLSHKHNATVNRHRQNGLQTFQILVEAGSTGSTQDIILSHAAASIFSPQETGYTKQSQQSAVQSPNMIDMAVRSATRSADASQ